MIVLGNGSIWLSLVDCTYPWIIIIIIIIKFTEYGTIRFGRLQSVRVTQWVCMNRRDNSSFFLDTTIKFSEPEVKIVKYFILSSYLGIRFIFL